MAKRVLNNPSPDVLMNSMRSIGYSFKTAVADIIDNSISAHATEVRIYTPINDDLYVAFFDDGDGMDRDELLNAMKYGSNRESYGEHDLGRFGLGLKSASLSQCRRLIILGVYKDVGIKCLDITLPNYDKRKIDFFNSGILEEGDVDKKYYISRHQEKVLQCWNEFIQGIKYIPSRKTDRKTKEKSYIKTNFNGTVGFPIWAFEFMETYDYSNEKYEWKKDFIAKNRYLYQFNKRFIDTWLKKWNIFDNFTPTEQKLEWQCGSECVTIWDGLIQFRPSGVRVKTATVFPALVAMVQIPIIGKVKRRLTPREAARLQSFPDDFIINSDDHQAYKQFGNAVNVNVIQYMANQLFKQR